MTLESFIHSTITRLASLYPEAEAKAIAFRLLEHFTKIPSYKYIAEPDMEIPGDASDLMEALDSLATGRPLQYVLGFTEF